MPCFHPITAYRLAGQKTNDGQRNAITFDPSKAIPFSEFKIPCGQCIGCRLSKSREWAARCVVEAKSHKNNMFLTLTYDDAHLPEDDSLHYEHFQLFMKRMRKYFMSRFGQQLRFFMCGEYGDKLGRPHYHAIIFGVTFVDKQLWSIRRGNNLYRSRTLEKLWPYGFSSIGSVNFETAAYVARYVTKKITGPLKLEHYDGKVAEFCHCSLKPGIGHDFCEKYMTDIYTNDRLILSEKIMMNPPAYFDKLLERSDIVRYEEIKRLREKRGRDFEDTGETSPQRLSVRERVQELKAAKLRRVMEENQS
jgi:hypothetical protein